MTIRVLAYLECDECASHFNRLVSVEGLRHDELSSEIHDLVLAAEAENWNCRKNATEHICLHCLEPWN
jgi:hypothetical protein